jgi:hypothetical protein
VRAWFARSAVRQRVALAMVALLALGAVAAWGGSTGRPPERVSAMGTLPAPAQAASLPECRVRYEVERDWRTGFTAMVTVTNSGSSDIDGATLHFRFPGGQRIVTGDRWKQQGRDVTAALSLSSGRSVRLPFTARYRAENPLPLSFTLGEVPCDATVTGARSPLPSAGSPQQGGGEAAPEKHSGKGKKGKRDDGEGRSLV